MMRFWWLAVLLAFQAGCADASAPDSSSTPVPPVRIAFEASEEQQQSIDNVMARLQQAFSGIPIDEVTPSPLPGWWTVRVEGEFLEVSPDGRYVISGVLFDLNSGKPVNVSEQRAEVIRAEKLAAVPEAEQIIFKAPREQYKVYVFTDYTCGFCRALHEHMKGYNDLGISIHYLAFPRGGPDVEGAELMSQIWCAADRQAAITEAKKTGKLSRKSPACDDPVRRHYELGRVLGIRGTPAIFTTSGKSIPGYRAPDDLLAILKGE